MIIKFGNQRIIFGKMIMRVNPIAISPTKDVEGMHPENMGKLFYGGGVVGPCTSMAAV